MLIALYQIWKYGFSYLRPKILLNRAWQSKSYLWYKRLYKLHLFNIFLIVFIDLFVLLLEQVVPPTFYQPRQDHENKYFDEKFLNFMTRFAQGFYLVVIFLFLISYGLVIKKRRANKLETAELIDRLKARRCQFSSLKMGPESACSICARKYVQDEKVIELGCQAQHIYHSDCIFKFLEKAAHTNKSRR